MEAVFAHMANLQEEFFIQAKNNKKCAFINISTRNGSYFKASDEIRTDGMF
jgi:hypothetical protein